MEAHLARRLWQLIEPIHAVQYFCREPIGAMAEAGYRGYWMGYFAGRAAPLGAVGPDFVHAVFYNFDHDMVARALPDAWTFAPPEAALAARLAGSVQALRRILGDTADDERIATAAELAATAASGADPAGRALYGANRALPVPDEPLARLWHAATLLREHRGDGHVAALLVNGVSGRESHVLASLTRGIPRETYRASRRLDDEQWAAVLEGLVRRGFVTADSSVTAQGHELVADIEATTDALAASALTPLATDQVSRLFDVLLPVTRAVVASGDIPADSPMGLDLRSVVDADG